MITTQLANGAKVIAEAKRGDSHWVAAEWTDDKVVTWSLGAMRPDGKQDAYHGHYFDTKKEAIDNLAFRAFGLERTS